MYNNYRMSYVVLGGTKHVDEWNTNVDETDKLKIWNNCIKFIPSLTVSLVDMRYNFYYMYIIYIITLYMFYHNK